MTKEGISAAPGIVIGKAFLIDSESLVVPQQPVPPERVEVEVSKFKKALEETKEELKGLKARLAEKMGEDHARIFDAHLLILQDTLILDDTIAMIKGEGRNAADAFQRVIARVRNSFSNIEDEYLKDRFTDIQDIKKRLIRRLLGKETKSLNKPSSPAIIVANDLSPSDTAQFDKEVTLGYATDRGARTSHTALLARSQGVPAVVGLENISRTVKTGDMLILDGNCGLVVINPSEATLDVYRREIERFKRLEEQLLTLTGYPAETLDKRRIGLVANMDMPQEIDSVLSFGAQGIGLFRTEYFFIAQAHLPSEEEQYRVYRGVVEKLGGKPVVIRTLDIGGDKIVQYLHNSAELNPFMGWRGIRFCLTRKDIFKTQLRAIYRASAHGKVKIMFPMISQLEEVENAKKICAEVRDELARDKFHFDPDVEIGIMVETPSAVAMAEVLAKEVSFFSLGTNDLIQYTLAVDRGNSKISHLYRNLHPSIIKFIKMAVDAAHKQKIKVSLCGEMSGDPLSVVVLLGLQVDELSCSPYLIPEVKKIIRSVSYDECKTLVKRVLKYTRTDEVEAKVRSFLQSRCPELSVFESK